MQLNIPRYIQDAEEWASAKANAEFEQYTDWALVCRAAEAPCHHGEADCGYCKAVQEIFGKNEASVSQDSLAAALRSIIVGGPTKTTRVPLLTGPSNSAKSTLLYPLDDIFTPKRVLHKPALGSTFALRNITQKRFIFWDDYRPIEYAQEKTVTVSTFLSLFIGKKNEIQVSQSFNDGNLDVEWKRGVAFTSKQEGLWTPTKRVPEEDVRHMRNRVQEFVFEYVFPQGSLKDIEPCGTCFGRWVVRGAAAYDAASALRPLPLAEAQSALLVADPSSEEPVRGFTSLVSAVCLPATMADELSSSLLDLGAVDVRELAVPDWESLACWPNLRPLQKRRLLQHTAGLSQS